ncbi:fimbrial protein [Zobellella sp. DQSA1]|uniref:fimbrial protein n=1 Tax=Zobellella sp. DQSA1 TaxID=3342386 RepID=UPI0035C03417
MLGKVHCVVASCLSLSLLSGHAWSQGQGRVDVRGAVIETACAIDTESRDQAIEMATLPVGQLIRDGRGLDRPFSIKLIGCSLSRPSETLPPWRSFQVTFDGRADNGLFGVEGDVEGVALQISDSLGNIARPGAPLPEGEVVPGAMRLNYSMALVGNGSSLRAGSYHSSIRFKVDYY